MGATNIVDMNVGAAAGVDKVSSHVDLSGTGYADPARFQDALSRHTEAALAAVPSETAHGEVSLGKKMLGRAAGLADGIMHDQQYVSKMLEQATRTGDSMQLMKAMMALNDYQIRVQTISKTVSKAASAVDQLARLQ